MSVPGKWERICFRRSEQQTRRMSQRQNVLNHVFDRSRGAIGLSRGGFVHSVHGPSREPHRCVRQSMYKIW